MKAETIVAKLFFTTKNSYFVNELRVVCMSEVRAQYPMDAAMKWSAAMQKCVIVASTWFTTRFNNVNILYAKFCSLREAAKKSYILSGRVTKRGGG